MDGVHGVERVASFWKVEKEGEGMQRGQMVRAYTTWRRSRLEGGKGGEMHADRAKCDA